MHWDPQFFSHHLFQAQLFFIMAYDACMSFGLEPSNIYTVRLRPPPVKKKVKKKIKKTKKKNR